MRKMVLVTTGAVLAAPCLFGASVQAQGAPVETITIVERRGLAEDLAAGILPASVLNIERIEATGAHHPAELVNQIPGVGLHRGSGAEHLTAIRSPVLTGGAGAGSFLYLQDGIPLRAAGFANVNGLFEAPTDLATGLEVVRGPGGAQYGSNALHGLVNVQTARPGEGGYALTAEGGSFGRYRGSYQQDFSDQGLPLVVGVAGRHEDGWRDEAGLDHVTGLVRFAGTLGENIAWLARVDGVSLNQETAGFIFGDRVYEDEAASRRNNDPEAFRDAWALRASMDVDGRIHEAWSWQVTPFWRRNEMDFLMHFLPSEALEESGHESVGWRSALRYDGETQRIALGLDTDWTDGFLRETQERPTLFSFVQGPHYDYDIEARVMALYARGEQDLSDRLRLSGGLRYENTRSDYTNNLPSNTVGRFLRLPDREDEFDTLTGQIGLHYRLNETSSVFGRVARGARAPQTAELYRLQPTQEIEEIEPEEIDSVDLGWRYQTVDGLSVELVGFVMQKQNVFFRDADGINVTDGQTDHIGVEFDVYLPLGEALSARWSGTWAEHTYAFDRLTGSATESITDGDAVDTAPEWLWTAGVNWQVTPAGSVSLDWSHVGEYATDAANAHEYDGHDIFSLRGRYALTESLVLFASVRNLFDTRYAERADFGFGNDRYFPGEGRGVSLGLRLEG